MPTSATPVPEAPAIATPEPSLKAPTDEPAAEEAAVARGASLPLKMRAKAKAEQRTRKAAAAGVVWGALGALVLALMASAALFRVDIVRLWPRTAGAYAKVGLPVNPTGLAPEGVHATPGLQNGHAAIIVSGMIRNVETHAQDPMPVRVTLLDKAGKSLAHEVIALAPGKLAPGQTRPFTVAFLDPPSAGINVEVSFVLDAPKPTAHDAKDKGHDGHAPAQTHEPPAHDAAPPAQGDHGQAHPEASVHALASDGASLRGPAQPDLPLQPTPASAQSLPHDSPYALPTAAREQGRPHIARHDG